MTHVHVLAPMNKPPPGPGLQCHACAGGHNINISSKPRESTSESPSPGSSLKDA